MLLVLDLARAEPAFGYRGQYFAELEGNTHINQGVSPERMNQ